MFVLNLRIKLIKKKMNIENLQFKYRLAVLTRTSLFIYRYKVFTNKKTVNSILNKNPCKFFLTHCRQRWKQKREAVLLRVLREVLTNERPHSKQNWNLKTSFSTHLEKAYLVFFHSAAFYSTLSIAAIMSDNCTDDLGSIPGVGN